MAKPNRFEPNLNAPLGILGGGQLARLLALKAHDNGIPVAIFCEKSNEPAAQVCADVSYGKPNDKAALKRFIQRCSTVTFESEFLDSSLLTDLSTATKTQIWPKPSHMGLLQDRLSQKKLFEKFGLPTSKFVKVDTTGEAEKAFRKLGGAVVFKKRRFGYDGNGTFICLAQDELHAFLHRFTEFNLDGSGFIAEKFVPFQSEFAVIIARGHSGDVLTLPFVESRQESSRCLWVKGPLKETKTTHRLTSHLLKFISKIGYVGVMGVELFQTQSGFLINEIAPRVHNTGHYSLNALSEDQFTLHLKAVLGMPLHQPKLLTSGFAMLNLIGDGTNPVSWTVPDEVFFHWYGKTENRKGRKMGHLTALASTPEKALNIALKSRSAFHV
jgi:5-(carboxyamino)imidazole ribonucleotide synthase